MDSDYREHELTDVIDLGAASVSTGAMPYGADDSRTGLFMASGLTVD